MIDGCSGSSITNLDSLLSVVSIGGSLSINYTHMLNDFTGLNNLSSIGGRLRIEHNEALSDMTGLSKLVRIDSSFTVSHNNALNNFSGLDKLNSVGGYFDIIANPNLESLDGLETLHKVKNISFQHNDILNDLSALQKLDSIHGTLRIGSNDRLTNLEGLNHVEFVGLDLLVYDNDSLFDFTGFDNLNMVGDWVGIWGNGSLNSLSGMENLLTIGGDLSIGLWHQYPFSPYGNHSLISLEGLQSLQSIGGNLNIEENISLTSLSGLENINPNSIGELHIHHNDSLSMCEVESICNYLIYPGAIVEVYENAAGCNSIEEVKEGCGINVGIAQFNQQGFLLYPNPANNGRITFTQKNLQNLQLFCFNAFGQQVHQQEITSTETAIDVSTWASGIYLVVLYEEDQPVGRTKFVVWQGKR